MRTVCLRWCVAALGGLMWLGGIASYAAEKEAPEELVQMVVGLLGEKDKDLRAVGLAQVREEAKGKAATLRFAAELPKLAPEAQVGLLSALADRGDTAARPALTAMLQSGNEEVRVAAIRALGPLGSADDVRLLAQSLATGAAAEKTAARASLVRLLADGVSASIVAQMKQASPPQRVAIIEVLAARRATETSPDLLPVAVDADPLLRAAAMTALGQLAGPEHVAGMARGVLKAEPGLEREAAEKCVMFACARIADPEKRADPLLAALDGMSAADRTSLLPTIGRVGGSAALKLVEAAIADADTAVHAAGLRAVCNWPEASIAPRLIELAQSDSHAEHRDMALAALIRVAPLPDKRPPAERLALLKKALGMCSRDEERMQVLKRARAIRTMDTFRFLEPYLDQPAFAQVACESMVELAHHRELRQPNKADFDRVLDKVMQTSKDPVVVERANRYKKNQTWAKPQAQ